jgi:hypothetical protein
MSGSHRQRYLSASLRCDLARKMVFVAGARQVGKTTLALGLPGALWIFDEIHKYRRWRNYVKGLYDGRRALCLASGFPASICALFLPDFSQHRLEFPAASSFRAPLQVLFGHQRRQFFRQSSGDKLVD